MPKLINDKIFPFHIKDHPQLQRYINITIISSIIIVTSATYLFGYFFSIGYFDRLLFSTLNLSKSFQARFEDLNKYDNISGFYYVAGLINYFVWSIFYSFLRLLFIRNEKR
ncbi:GerAB/ArcD/ProY family transporter [Neorhizobium galegae]|uniref:GerAB/ArcD/ProY family transporter n=1 Tax=Neorhizobium galegae TaxID=399 RepID=A0A6A1TR67_NEOGA|nr:GerAB/ArcD/ProY family transporter [Neorhizobium galegae]